ncbi:MAG: hypothetical protein KKB21_00760 [Nanoarchaeota archaeon]|nr:hypothetical protein [Nanoarchaeota archaeon]
MMTKNSEAGEFESQILRESRELHYLKIKIHEMLKELIIKADIGEIREGYADDIKFDIGEYSIYSCRYYEQLRIVDSEDIEYELDHNLEAARQIY